MAALRPTPMMHRGGANGLPRPASAGDIASLGAGLSQREGGAAAAPTTSKNSGGSELFDALLMAATGTAAAAAGGGDAIPVGGAVATAGSPGAGEQQVSSSMQGSSYRLSISRLVRPTFTSTCDCHWRDTSCAMATAHPMAELSQVRASR